MTGDNFDPESAWELLTAGNERFASGHPRHPHQDAAQRIATLSKQNPYAVILTCSDSRVPPEIVFDCGLGDLFVVRIAGNIVTPEVLGTVEFAITALAIPLIVVMGHQSCVAVQEAMNRNRYEGSFQAYRIINTIVLQIKHTDDISQAIAENTIASVRELHKSVLVSERIAKGELQICAAYYDITSGQVRSL